jgi:hypothetical protein
MTVIDDFLIVAMLQLGACLHGKTNSSMTYEKPPMTRNAAGSAPFLWTTAHLNLIILLKPPAGRGGQGPGSRPPQGQKHENDDIVD